jgi:hypothetical protein
VRHPPLVAAFSVHDPATYDMERRSTPTGLESCLVCGQDFVSMARCTRAGSGTWWLLLRCGACGTWHETFARDEPVAALQRATARGVHALRSQVDAFCEALELDLIGPDEFRSPSVS